MRASPCWTPRSAGSPPRACRCPSPTHWRTRSSPPPPRSSPPSASSPATEQASPTSVDIGVGGHWLNWMGSAGGPDVVVQAKFIADVGYERGQVLAHVGEVVLDDVQA